MSAPAAVQATPRDDALLAIALRAANAAAQEIRAGAHNLRSLAWQLKSPADFVSDVDRAAEVAIRDVIIAGAPSAALMGEELSPDTPVGAGLVFVADPLDGTTNFLHGYPEYAVSIAAVVDGQIAAGVVLNVPTGECFTAIRGRGTFRDETRVTVSSISDPSLALIGTGFPFKYPEQIPPFLRQMPAVLRRTAGIRRAGSAALDLADVACGRFDAFWELRLAPWDIAAGILLVREAGGVVTDLSGHDAGVAHSAIVAGNPVMHDWLLRLLRDPPADDVP
jgi:myo-inositol-1(or 4)-monophosphatase